MDSPKIGILHPGAMGISVAVSAKDSGYTVLWASEGRSEDTKNRADEYHLMDGHCQVICRWSEIWHDREMKISNELFKNHRFPAEIIQYAVWLYVCFYVIDRKFYQ